jgi:hypothetical protein
MNDNPILLHVQRVQMEAEQHRIMERALAEATPLEKAGIGRCTSPGDRARLRGTPVITTGIPGTGPGTDPLALEVLDAAAKPGSAYRMTSRRWESMTSQDPAHSV